MLRLLVIVMSFLAISCSSEKAVQSIRPNQKTASPVVTKPTIARERHQLTDTTFTSPSQARDIAPSLDSLHFGNGKSEMFPDTTFGEADQISEKMELARQHYLNALSSQETGDTTAALSEFEQSIQILNDLADDTDVESGKDYIDLSKSLAEDYEKLLVTSGKIDENTSVFALREILSQEVETIDTAKVTIPKVDVVGAGVPLPLNDQVEKNLAFFMGRGSHYIEKWLYLEGRYMPLMKRIFREEGVPEELVYLSMPESGLRTDAKSWVRAVGQWQFMKGTGSLYGLRVNWWYDERRDFEKATRAAARHLKDLYSEFGDWNLVLGAYNAGAGRIFRGIRRSGSTDYWTMRKHLPRQTRNYVSQFIAVVRIAKDPEKYGFKGLVRADSLAFEYVEVNDCVDLKVLARSAGTTADTLRDLNPELLQWCTPPGVKGYRLRVPPGRKEMFAANYAAIPDDQKRDWAIHTVRKGETLSSIASRYGLSIAFLQEVNKFKNIRKLSIGTIIAIPLPKEVAAKQDKMQFDYNKEIRKISFNRAKKLAQKDPSGKRSKAAVKQTAGKERLAYRVKRGDTLGHIAEWYGVRASDIRNWNDIAYGDPIRAGQELTIWVTQEKVATLRNFDLMSFSEKESMRSGDAIDLAQGSRLKGKGVVPAPSQSWTQHEVIEGESLDKIARQYGTTVEDLKNWNQLTGNRIRVGQKLEIYNLPERRVNLIPAPATNKAAPEPLKEQTPGEIVHKVKKGETVFEIARSYSVQPSVLMAYNNLRTSKLRVGQILRIPASTHSGNIINH